MKQNVIKASLFLPLLMEAVPLIIRIFSPSNVWCVAASIWFHSLWTVCAWRLLRAAANIALAIAPALLLQSQDLAFTLVRLIQQRRRLSLICSSCLFLSCSFAPIGHQSLTELVHLHLARYRRVRSRLQGGSTIRSGAMCRGLAEEGCEGVG